MVSLNLTGGHLLNLQKVNTLKENVSLNALSMTFIYLKFFLFECKMTKSVIIDIYYIWKFRHLDQISRISVYYFVLGWNLLVRSKKWTQFSTSCIKNPTLLQPHVPFLLNSFYKWKKAVYVENMSHELVGQNSRRARLGVRMRRLLPDTTYICSKCKSNANSPDFSFLIKS